MRECTNKWIGSDEIKKKKQNFNTRITVFPNSCESGVRFVLNLHHVLRIGMLTCTNLTTEKGLGKGKMGIFSGTDIDSWE